MTDQTKYYPESVTASTPADLAFEAEVDNILSERDELTSLVAILHHSKDEAPTEVIARYQGLKTYPPLLAAVRHKISVMRGDFPAGDPAANPGARETYDERALRVYMRGEEIKRAHGLKGYRSILIEEERVGLSYIKQLVRDGRELHSEQSRQTRKRS